MHRGSAARSGAVLAIVPAFNEAGVIGEVVRQARALTDRPDIVVIDDGSADGTAEEAEREGAAVLRLPFNCGIGAAVQTGLRFAVNEGYEFVVRIDGDGQHDPSTLPALLAPLRDGVADFAIGSRFLDRAGFQSSFARRLGSRWFAALLRLVCGQRLSDPTSGFWGANRRAMLLLAGHYASDYPEVDSIVRLLRHGCAVTEVPVVMRPRVAGGSSIGLSNAVYYMVKVTVALLISRVSRP